MNEVDCHGDEAIFHDGACVGHVSSGGYAHYVKKSVALGYVPTALATPDQTFEVEILGILTPARLQAEALYDPKGERLRG